MIRPRTISVLGALTALVLLVGCSDDGKEEGQDGEPSTTTEAAAAGAVAVEDYEFRPAQLEVDVGSTVRWTNEGAAQHTVRSLDGQGFESEVLAGTDTFEHRFSEPGEYGYECGIHSTMRGVVTVE